MGFSIFPAITTKEYLEYLYFTKILANFSPFTRNCFIAQGELKNHGMIWIGQSLLDSEEQRTKVISGGHVNESFETEYLTKSFISFIPDGSRAVGIRLFRLLALLFVFIALKLNNLWEGIVSFRGSVYSKKKK